MPTTIKMILAALAVLPGVPAGAATMSALRAGAAKVEITPASGALKPGDTIRDRLFVRALVIRNADDCAVLVGIDQIVVNDKVASPAIRRASVATRCAIDGFIVSATHTHSGSTGGLMKPGEPDETIVEDAIVTAVNRANAALRPARIAFGTTKLDLNVNRDLFVDNRWTQGPNEQAPSDKTLAVVELLGADDLPIGVYLTYAMHPVHFFLSGVVSADFPGDASRYIEKRFGSHMVAIFAQGASGDQNPRLQRPYNRLVAVRTGTSGTDDVRVTARAPWLQDAGERNAIERMMSAMDAPVPPTRARMYQEAIADNDTLVSAVGSLIGETAINTMRFGMGPLVGTTSIASSHEAFQCPGRDRQDGADPVRENALPPYANGAPVAIRVGMVRIGDIHLGWVNGEVYGGIATRLKEEAPVTRLTMTTLANGMANSGYIYSNDAAAHLTFQVIGSRLKPGCAEDRIVASGLRLIDTLGR